MKPMPKNDTIKLLIQNFADRQAMVNALANSGYKTWVKEIHNENKIFNATEYWVYFHPKRIYNNEE